MQLHSCCMEQEANIAQERKHIAHMLQTNMLGDDQQKLDDNRFGSNANYFMRARAHKLSTLLAPNR